MKKLALFFMTTTVALATVCLLQSRKLASQQEQVISPHAQAEQKSEEDESLRAAETSAREEVQELQHGTTSLTAQPATHQQPEGVVATPMPVTPAGPSASFENQVEPAGSTKPTEDQNGFSGFLSKLMNDPDSRKFIRDQQRLILDQLYAPLVKQLALSPDESETFKDLLADSTMKGAENASFLFAGGTNQTQTLEKLASSQQSLDDQVKALLGEDRYLSYKDYQQTVAERMQLNQFKQTAGADSPLTDQQTETLLGIMKEEKAAAAAAAGQSFPEVGKDASNFQAMLSDESLEKLLQSQGIVNDRVYQRASQFLSPEQMTAFGRFQTNQLQMMRLSMTMARKFFTPDKSTAAANQ